MCKTGRTGAQNTHTHELTHHYSSSPFVRSTYTTRTAQCNVTHICLVFELRLYAMRRWCVRVLLALQPLVKACHMFAV